MLFALWYLCRNLPNQRRYLEDMLKRSDTGYNRYWYNKKKKKKHSWLAIGREQRKCVWKKLFQKRARKYFAISQRRANKTNPLLDTFIEHTRNKKQLNTIKEDLFWYYITWNWEYIQVSMFWISLYLFFTKRSAIQRLDTAVQCTLHFRAVYYLY